MSVLIPGGKIDASQVTAMRLALRAKLLAAVGQTMGQSTIIRDLITSDWSGKTSGNARFARYSNATALTAQTWTTTGDVTPVQIANNQAIGIYAYVALAPVPSIDGIRLGLGGVQRLAQFFLDPVYADLVEAIGYFDPPVVYGPLQTVQVDLLAEVALAAGTEQFALLGYIAEPAGQTVNADQTALV
jgi:hypothetical protein